MTTTTAHTPLEAYSLFQLLFNHETGVSSNAFRDISHTLRNNKIIRNDETYDADRLSPEALRELFLQTLREELRNEDNQSNGDKNGASLSPNSRKRKLASPKISSLQDTLPYLGRFPLFLDSLYKQYADDVARKVYKDTEDIRRLEEDIKQLELQEEQENASRQELRAASRNGAASSIESSNARLPNGTGPASSGATPELRTSPLPTQQRSPAGVPLPTLAPPVTSPASGSPAQLSQAAALPSGRISPLPQGAIPPILQPPQGAAQLPPRPATNTPQPPIPDIQQRAQATAKPKLPLQAQQAASSSGALKWEPPYQPTPPPMPRSASDLAHIQPQTPQPQTWNTQDPLRHPSPYQQSPQPQGASPLPLHAPQPVSLSPQHIAQFAQSQGALARPLLAANSQVQQQQSSYPSPVSGQPGTLPQQQQEGSSTSPDARLVGSVSPAPAFPGRATLPLQGTQFPNPGVSTQYKPAPLAVVPPSNLGQTPGQVRYNSPFDHAAASVKAVLDNLQSLRVSTPTPSGRPTPHPILPQTPISGGYFFQAPRGSGTKWRSSEPTPSTPHPEVGDVDSPAFEPLSPQMVTATQPQAGTPSETKKQPSKQVHKIDTSMVRPRGRPPRSGQKGQKRRSPSAVSQPDGVKSLDSAKIKVEEETPRPPDETGDTTADESVPSHRRTMTPSGPSLRATKRKRAESVALPSEEEPPVVSPPTHVLWTRGFPKISASALDQIGGHRYANMFAHRIRDRDAPNYSSIIRSPVDLKSIKTAIIAGNKAATTALATLPEFDSSASSVWLPIGEELVPPRGIINSNQLESELVHMFANAIMYNPDSYRGPGPAFMIRENTAGITGGGDASVHGYKVDEDAVVKEARAMYVEVEKILNEMRSAEKQRGPPPPLPPGATGTGVSMDLLSGAGDVEPAVAEDDVDEAANTEASGTGTGTGTVKRRRIARG